MAVARIARRSRRPRERIPSRIPSTPSVHRADAAIVSDGDLASEVLDAARDAAAKQGLGFAGNLPVREASVVFRAGRARLVDVRADIELDLEGYVPGSVNVPWALPPNFEVNTAFVAELAERVSKDEVLLFHCRRGSRSAAAALAAAQAGYLHAFNVDGGIDELLALFVDRSTTAW